MNWKIEGLNEFSNLHAMFFFCFRKVQDFCIYNLGCPNTPGKGVRYCDTHVGLARTYISEEDCEVGKRSLSTDEDLVIRMIRNNKLTRQGNLCEVIDKKIINQYHSQ